MSDILVDTSIWIDFFNIADSPEGIILDQLLDENSVVTTDLILAEILPFLPTKTIFNDIRLLMQSIPSVSFYDGIWNDIIENQYKIVRSGVNGVGIPDMMICCLAMHYNKLLYTKDKHFKLIAAHLPLQLFEITGPVKAS